MLSFLTAALWGRASDRFGRRPFLVLSAFTTAIPVICLYLSSNLWYYWGFSLAVAPLLGGSYANTAVLYPYISDVIPVEDRTRFFGYLYAISCVGFAVMPLVGAYVDTERNSHVLYSVAAGFAVAGLLYTTCFLPESLPREERAGLADGYSLNPCGSGWALLGQSKVVALLAGVTLASSLPESGLVESALFYVQVRNLTPNPNAKL